MELFHGSNSRIEKIIDDGLFGGLFATCNESAASSHGSILHTLRPENPLTDFELNYEIENAYEIALEISGGDERIADAIMSKGCESLDDCDPEDAADQGWEFQRLRGLLAQKLGYDAVEMEDEHGTTWLCLQGCSIEIA